MRDDRVRKTSQHYTVYRSETGAMYVDEFADIELVLHSGDGTMQYTVGLVNDQLCVWSPELGVRDSMVLVDELHNVWVGDTADCDALREHAREAEDTYRDSQKEQEAYEDHLRGQDLDPVTHQGLIPYILSTPFEQFIDINREWSEKTFGEGNRREGVCRHIESELKEIRTASSSEVLEEWVDVLLLALGGARREGYTGSDIWRMLCVKQAKNRRRSWPPPVPGNSDEPIFHKHEPEHPGWPPAKSFEGPFFYERPDDTGD